MRVEIGAGAGELAAGQCAGALAVAEDSGLLAGKRGLQRGDLVVVAPNSRIVRKRSFGREGICAKNHEQWPPEFTSSQSAGSAFSSPAITSRGSSKSGSTSNTWLSAFVLRMRAAMASVRHLLLRSGRAAVSASTPSRASARKWLRATSWPWATATGSISMCSICALRQS